GGDSAAQDGGESGAQNTSRGAKNGGETPKRGKSARAGGASKKAVATSDRNEENAIETLYLSSENEAYRNADATDEASLETNGRYAANVGFETSAPKNDAK
ncbi:MAG: hypothetical protein IKY61_02600, partial [Thermoguttaceae bacterium]|nr:hypothetical protein [Thermoguttaceae bacterium]